MASAAPTPAAASPALKPVAAAASVQSTRPAVDASITQLFIPVRSNPPEPNATAAYQPMLLGCATIYFTDSKTGVNQEQPVNALTPLTTAVVPADWSESEDVDFVEADLDTDPQPGAAFAALPPTAGRAKSYDLWKKSLVD